MASCYVSFIACSAMQAILPSFMTFLFPIMMLGLCMVLYPNTLINNKSFLCAIIYAATLFISLLNHQLSGIGYGTGSFDTFLIEIGFILPSIAISAILIQNKNMINYKTLTIVFICSIVISFLFVLPVVITDKAMIRRLSYYQGAVNGTTISNEILKFKSGFWSYTMLHVISLSFPILWGLSRNIIDKNFKFICTIVSVLILYIVLQMSITTTFIYIMCIVALLFCRYLGKYGIMGVLVVLFPLIFLLLNADFILLQMQSYYAGTDMAPKIKDFIDIMNGGEGTHGSIEGRINFQRQAFEAFWTNPIIGSSYQGGGHSILLNRIGTTGLCGFIPYILIIYFQFKQWYNDIPSTSKFYFLLSWLGAAILLYAKNCFGQEGFLFISVIIPSLAQVYIERNYQANIYSLKPNNS